MIHVMARRFFLPLPILVAFATGARASVACAHEYASHRERGVRSHHASAASVGAPVTYRGLTINRPPEIMPLPGGDQDIYRDGPIRYNDIRDFSPAPYTTSGVQYPYGLDGIGGYGSDLGFGAGQDSALYNRGAGTTP